MLMYLDTNIYLDYWESRRDSLRPLGEFAFSIIRRAVECEFEILISNLFLHELKERIKEEEIGEVLRQLKEAGQTHHG
jgi:hypothetical protein